MPNSSARRFACSLALIAGLGACGLTPSPFEGQHFKLETFGYWGDSFEWEASREGMSREQLEALQGLRLIAGTSPCVADVQEVSLTVTDAKGRNSTFRGNEENAPCGHEERMMDYASLKPLLSALECVGTGKATTTLSGAKSIRADSGCRHGLFSSAGQPPVWLKVTPSEAGRMHTFEVSHCEGKMTSLELFNEEGTTLLASNGGDGSPGAPCAKLELMLETDRPYALRVTSQAVSTGGHVLLEFKRLGTVPRSMP